MKTFAITTLGCKVNYYDSESVIKLLTDSGYKFVNFDDIADIYIINTCSVTNLSDRKSRQILHRARKKNKNAIIIAMGCYAQSNPDNLIKTKTADLIIGTNNRKDILKLIEQYEKNKVASKKILDVRQEFFFEEMQILNKNDRCRAFIKIQEGCNEFCSYCIIPYTRGKSRSRNLNKIYDEAKNLCQSGFKEIVLTGINVSAYGKDLENDLDLADVIEKLHEIKNLERIRLSSVEPNLINDSFISKIKLFPKLCPHFHMSLQSGSNKILHAMNRKYTTIQYFEAVQKLKNTFENVSITTDIITGFPGETDEDFQQTYDFAKQIGFSKIHVFPYSPRKNTRAYNFSNTIDSAVKKIRSTKLIELSEKLANEYIKSFISKTLPTLIEEKENGKYTGYTNNYIKVFIESNEDLINKIVNTKIVSANKEFANGEIVS